jgi:hypothetical protein
MAKANNPTTGAQSGTSQSLAEQTDELTDRLESLTDADVSVMSDEELVELRTSIKELENQVKDTRKDVVETELENRVEPGESMLGLKRVQSHSKFVAEDAETVVARAVANGIDYGQFTSVSASKLADTAPEIAEIGRNEYTYFR